ncbi:MAG TPA: hypothetical protein DEQ41_08020 [Shewanella sp.]|nr:hypothetical protein [Shewanella sp.]
MEGLFQSSRLTGLFLLIFLSFSLAPEDLRPRRHLSWITAAGKMVELCSMNGKLRSAKTSASFNQQ